MISFTLNNEKIEYEGDETLSLLSYLRESRVIISVKDGCSGQAACGACMVELDGKPALACSTKMNKIDGKSIITIEGIPERVRGILARAFVSKGAVQCGFCTPGMLTRVKILLDNNLNPSREDVVKSLGANVCRCTGYLSVIDAVLLAARALREDSDITLAGETGIGYSVPKHEGLEKALGESPFIKDMKFDSMLYGVLKFSDHPRARVVSMDVSPAENISGVIRVFTAGDIPGQRHQGLIVKDWPMMVKKGEVTRYIGDVLAGVVAETEELARRAVEAIVVEYEILEPLTDLAEAPNSAIKIHEGGNLLQRTEIKRGDPVDRIFEKSAHIVEGRFETPFVDHAFLETEASIALPDGREGITVYSQSQGIFSDRAQIASLLDIPKDRVNVVQVCAGGAFGGKEDLTVQHHAALYSRILKSPVMVSLNRAESIRMHPKRHRTIMSYKLACDSRGLITALRARILGDTGAYASVGGEVVARIGTHAAGAYHVPNVDVEASAYYTNNIPAGAFRGFGVNQATFAMESMVDDLCEAGGFDRWQFRYDNALDTGRVTTTGQVLGKGVGLRKCLEAVKGAFYESEYAGLACAIKNCGIGNGLEELSETRLRIKSPDHIELCHGWTEMGQGINTIARQILCETLDLDKSIVIDIKCATNANAMGGMTTASRGTALLGNSIIDAAWSLEKDLKNNSLSNLVGREYYGRFMVDWTTTHEADDKIVSHFSYGYAVHLAILDETGRIEEIQAAHDGGKILNPALFNGQIQGGVVMGMGYALKESLPLENGLLLSGRMSKLGLLKAKDIPDIKVIGIEDPDPVGPFGAKGVGEISCIPTTPAIANAFCQYDGKRRYELPLSPLKKQRRN